MMLRGALYGILAASIWGGMYVVSDVVLKIIPPFTLLTIRLVLGLLVLSYWIWSANILKGVQWRDAIKLMAVGVVGFGMSVGAQFVGTDKSSAINGTLITSASPAFILVFGTIILREHLSFQRVFAVILATIGVIIIIDPANANFNSDTFFGDVVLLVAALTWGLYSVLVRLVSGNYDTMLVTWFAFIGGLLITVPASLLELPTRPIGIIDFPVILGVLYLGVVSTAGAMWWWNRAFALVPAGIASLFFFAQPLVGTILSVVFLGQQMTIALWMGSVLIVAGVLVAIVQPKSKKD
jgi:drug/metabolite transporter (DMT)-like permease